MKKGEWLEAFSLGLDMFHQRTKRLLGIPSDTKIIKPALERVVLEYTRMQTIGWEYKIGNSMEYCIGIDSTDLLFEDLFQYFIDAGPETNLGLFMDRLEPFILHGEVTNIPTLVLGRIIGYLLNINRPDVVERIIIHLDPNCIDP